MEVNFLSHSGQMQSGCLFLSLKELPELLLDDRFEAGVQVVGVVLLDDDDCSLLSLLSSSSFLRKPRSSMS